MIYTFYSYKGGVGRSMALANVAEAFRARGLRVLLVDWDLEAPGLEEFFCSTPDELNLVRSQPGVIDLLQEYRRMHARLLLGGVRVTDRRQGAPPGEALETEATGEPTPASEP